MHFTAFFLGGGALFRTRCLFTLFQIHVYINWLQQVLSELFALESQSVMKTVNVSVTGDIIQAPINLN